MERVMEVGGWIRKVLKKLKRDRVNVYAAQAAFFILMSVVPIVMLLMTILQYTPITEADVLNLLARIFPPAIQPELEKIVTGVYDSSFALLSGTAVAAVWSAGKGVMGISQGLNSVHHQEETRSYFVVRLRSAVYTLGLLFSLILAIGILVFGYPLQKALIAHIPVLRNIEGSVFGIQTVIALVLLASLFILMYEFLPNRRLKFKNQVLGAVFTSLGWAIFSNAFSLYLELADNFTTIYGGLAVLVVIMLWLYFCMYILFLGAELNVYLADKDSFFLTEQDCMIK